MKERLAAQAGLQKGNKQTKRLLIALPQEGEITSECCIAVMVRTQVLHPHTDLLIGQRDPANLLTLLGNENDQRKIV